MLQWSFCPEPIYYFKKWHVVAAFAIWSEDFGCFISTCLWQCLSLLRNSFVDSPSVNLYLLKALSSFPAYLVTSIFDSFCAWTAFVGISPEHYIDDDCIGYLDRHSSCSYYVATSCPAQLPCWFHRRFEQYSYLWAWEMGFQYSTNFDYNCVLVECHYLSLSLLF